MDLNEAKRKWREKNARRAKPISVEVPGVGTLYMRPLKVSDGDRLEALVKSTDGNVKATHMATLLCNEDGSQLSPDEMKEWTEILTDADWSDYLLLTAAGTKPLEDATGN